MFADEPNGLDGRGKVYDIGFRQRVIAIRNPKTITLHNVHCSFGNRLSAVMQELRQVLEIVRALILDGDLAEERLENFSTAC